MSAPLTDPTTSIVKSPNATLRSERMKMTAAHPNAGAQSFSREDSSGTGFATALAVIVGVGTIARVDTGTPAAVAGRARPEEEIMNEPPQLAAWIASCVRRPEPPGNRGALPGKTGERNLDRFPPSRSVETRDEQVGCADAIAISSRCDEGVLRAHDSRAKLDLREQHRTASARGELDSPTPPTHAARVRTCDPARRQS